MSNPAENYEQIIADFETQQTNYQFALEARKHAKQNEELQRQIYFQQQQMANEESEKRDRRCQLVQKVIDSLSQIIQEFEQGDCFRLNDKLTHIKADMIFNLDNRILKDGR